MFPAVQAHADMLGKDDIILLLFVPVFPVKLPGIAPMGGAMFLSRPSVLAC